MTNFDGNEKKNDKFRPETSKFGQFLILKTKIWTQKIKILTNCDLKNRNYDKFSLK